VTALRGASIPGAIAALVASCALHGCAAPRQYGGPIAVDTAGFQRRLDMPCRFGIGACPDAADPAEIKGPK